MDLKHPVLFKRNECLGCMDWIKHRYLEIFCMRLGDEGGTASPKYLNEDPNKTLSSIPESANSFQISNGFLTTGSAHVHIVRTRLACAYSELILKEKSIRKQKMRLETTANGLRIESTHFSSILLMHFQGWNAMFWPIGSGVHYVRYVCTQLGSHREMQWRISPCFPIRRRTGANGYTTWREDSVLCAHTGYPSEKGPATQARSQAVSRGTLLVELKTVTLWMRFSTYHCVFKVFEHMFECTTWFIENRIEIYENTDTTM